MSERKSKKKVTQDSLIVDIIELMGKKTGSFKWELSFQKMRNISLVTYQEYEKSNWYYCQLSLGDFEMTGEGSCKTKRAALRLFLRQLKQNSSLACSFKEV